MRNHAENRKSHAVKWITLIFCFAVFSFHLSFLYGSDRPEKPRLLISTDIGGTDPDDFQSMIHFLMYSDRFETEGLISSPSYGEGTVGDILSLIDLYEQDLPRLSRHLTGYPAAEALRAVTKQGRHGAAPYRGFSTATEGSDWIVRCARRGSDKPLWVLVWGGLDDLAQALHDAPDIQDKIRVYWIGGPNKKWSSNSYAYIAEHFPRLWFIENNASYRGFFPARGVPDSLSNERYYERYVAADSHLGANFGQHYGGRIKMGDSPSLFYLMHGDPDNPGAEGWGGSFEPMTHSPRAVFEGPTTLSDTVCTYAVIEFHLDGSCLDLPAGTPCFTLDIARQQWEGYYFGEGKYRVRYAVKEAETLHYRIYSDIPGFPGFEGRLVAENRWPGEKKAGDYTVGPHWFTDRGDPELFVDKWQGGQTILRWRSEILLDWAERWNWLRD